MVERTSNRSSVVFRVAAVVIAPTFLAIQTLTPVFHLPDLLVAFFVFLVAVWTEGIVDVVPVCWRRWGGFVLLSLFAASTRAVFMGAVESIDILVIADPVFESCLDDRFSDSRRSCRGFLIFRLIRNRGGHSDRFKVHTLLCRRSGTFRNSRLKSKRSYLTSRKKPIVSKYNAL